MDGRVGGSYFGRAEGITLGYSDEIRFKASTTRGRLVEDWGLGEIDRPPFTRFTWCVCSGRWIRTFFGDADHAFWLYEK